MFTPITGLLYLNSFCYCFLSNTVRQKFYCKDYRPFNTRRNKGNQAYIGYYETTNP